MVAKEAPTKLKHKPIPIEVVDYEGNIEQVQHSDSQEVGAAVESMDSALSHIRVVAHHSLNEDAWDARDECAAKWVMRKAASPFLKAMSGSLHMFLQPTTFLSAVYH